MNQNDLFKKMGKPDKINPDKRLKSKKWKCSKCGNFVISQESMTTPKPCRCGSIFFETLNHREG